MDLGHRGSGRNDFIVISDREDNTCGNVCGAVHIAERNNENDGLYEINTKILGNDGSTSVHDFAGLVSFRGNTLAVSARWSVYIFTRDPITGQWMQTGHTGVDLSSPSDIWIEALIVGDGMYLVGSNSQSFLFEYDASTDTWIETVRFPHDGRHAQFDPSSKTISFLGGNTFAFMYSFFEDSSTWNLTTSLPLDGGHYISLYNNTFIASNIYDGGDGCITHWCGAASIFDRNPITGVWNNTGSRIFASNRDSNRARFGSQVSLADDNTAIISAPYDGSCEDECGSVYIFLRDSQDPTKWNEAHKIYPDISTAADSSATGVGLHFGIRLTASANKIAIGTSSYDHMYVVVFRPELEDLCLDCPPGTHATDDGECTPCPAGHYSSIYGAQTCEQCPPATFSTVIGAKSSDECTPCILGGTTSTAGSSSCPLLCSAGYYRPAGSPNDCQICTAGTSSGLAASSCATCPAGSYSATNGADECRACPQGLTNTEPFSTTCFCAAGSYSNSTIAQSGTTDPSACTLCPIGSMSSEIASEECTDCNTPGFFQDEAGQTYCKTCTAQNTDQPTCADDDDDDSSTGDGDGLLSSLPIPPVILVVSAAAVIVVGVIALALIFGGGSSSGGSSRAVVNNLGTKPTTTITPSAPPSYGDVEQKPTLSSNMVAYRV